MGMRYDSFVLRCWRLGGAQRRFQVQHLQSGATTLAVALPAALDWIDARCGRRVAAPGEVSPADDADSHHRPTD